MFWCLLYFCQQNQLFLTSFQCLGGRMLELNNWFPPRHFPSLYQVSLLLSREVMEAGPAEGMHWWGSLWAGSYFMLCIHNYLHINRFLCVQKWRSERGLLLLSRVNSFYINQRCHGQVSFQQSLNKGKWSFQPGVLGLHHRPFSTACRSWRFFFWWRKRINLCSHSQRGEGTDTLAKLWQKYSLWHEFVILHLQCMALTPVNVSVNWNLPQKVLCSLRFPGLSQFKVSFLLDTPISAFPLQK